MTSERSFRSALGEEVALGELQAGAGTQFDAAVVEVFLRRSPAGATRCRRLPSPNRPRLRQHGACAAQALAASWDCSPRSCRSRPITLLIYPLREVVPVVSTGVVYTLAVLLVSSYWGLCARPADRGAERGGLELLPHPAHRRLHDRGRRELGGAGGVLHRRGRDQRARRRRPGAGRGGGDAAARGGPDRRDGAAAARRRRPRRVAALGGRSGSRRRSASPSVAIELSWTDSDERRRALPLLVDGARVGHRDGAARHRAERARGAPGPRRPRARDARRRGAQARRARGAGDRDEGAAALERRQDGACCARCRTTCARRSRRSRPRRPGSPPRRSRRGARGADLRDRSRERAPVAARRQPARPVEAPGGRASSRTPTGARSRSWSGRRSTACRDAAGRLRRADRRRTCRCVQADAGQLERAIANVLDNAARFAGDEPVSVRARAASKQVLLRVGDRGPGIAARGARAHLRAVPPRRARAPGTGLGLAIARGFLEANGGRIRAESLPGQGTTFVISLPVPAEQPAGAQAAE